MTRAELILALIFWAAAAVALANELLAYRRRRHDASTLGGGVVPRRAHNPEVAGSNPAPATTVTTAGYIPFAGIPDPDQLEEDYDDACVAVGVAVLESFADGASEVLVTRDGDGWSIEDDTD